MGFSLAGSYGNWGSSNTAKAAHSNNTHYWDLGLGYEYGPFGASVTYLSSQFDCGSTASVNLGNTGSCTDTGKNKFHDISTGIDYKLAPGLTPYAEVTWYNQNSAWNNSAVSKDNKGYVGIVGTQLNF